MGREGEFIVLIHSFVLFDLSTCVLPMFCYGFWLAVS